MSVLRALYWAPFAAEGMFCCAERRCCSTWRESKSCLVCCALEHTQAAVSHLVCIYIEKQNPKSIQSKTVSRMDAVLKHLYAAKACLLQKLRRKPLRLHTLARAAGSAVTIDAAILLRRKDSRVLCCCAPPLPLFRGLQAAVLHGVCASAMAVRPDGSVLVATLFVRHVNQRSKLVVLSSIIELPLSQTPCVRTAFVTKRRSMWYSLPTQQCLCWTPNNTLLVANSVIGGLDELDLASGRILSTLFPTHHIHSVALCNDVLALGCNTKFVLFRHSSMAVLGVVACPVQKYWSMFLGPDGVIYFSTPGELCGFNTGGVRVRTVRMDPQCCVVAGFVASSGDIWVALSKDFGASYIHRIAPGQVYLRPSKKYKAKTWGRLEAVVIAAAGHGCAFAFTTLKQNLVLHQLL